MLSRSLTFQQRRLNLATVLNFWSLITRVKATAVYCIITSWDSFALFGTLTQRSSSHLSACMVNFLQPKPFGSFKPVFFSIKVLTSGVKIFGGSKCRLIGFCILLPPLRKRNWLIWRMRKVWGGKGVFWGESKIWWWCIYSKLFKVLATKRKQIC